MRRGAGRDGRCGESGPATPPWRAPRTTVRCFPRNARRTIQITPWRRTIDIGIAWSSRTRLRQQRLQPVADLRVRLKHCGRKARSRSGPSSRRLQEIGLRTPWSAVTRLPWSRRRRAGGRVRVRRGASGRGPRRGGRIHHGRRVPARAVSPDPTRRRPELAGMRKALRANAARCRMQRLGSKDDL